MISSEDALNYTPDTERTNNFLQYTIEPAIKKCALQGKRNCDIVVLDKFTNLSLYEVLFRNDKSLAYMYLFTYDMVSMAPDVFYCMNKSIFQHRLNIELTLLGYDVVFNPVEHDKVNEAFGIRITW